MRDDTDEIDRCLKGQLERVLDTFAPGYIISGNRAYLSHNGPKRLGPLQVGLDDNDAGPPRGRWCDFSIRVNGRPLVGGPLALVAFLLKGQTGKPVRDDYRLAFEEARKFLGWNLFERVDHDAIRRANEAAGRRRRDAALARHRRRDKLQRSGR